jgi:hypothetical protein
LMFIWPVISSSFSLDITLGHQIFMIYPKHLFTKDSYIIRVIIQAVHTSETSVYPTRLHGAIAQKALILI